MKQTLKRTIITGAALSLLVSPAVALAEDGTSGSGDEPVSSTTTSDTDSRQERVRKFEAELRDRLEAKRQQARGSLDDKREALKQRLDDAKRKACENHVTTINRLMTVMDKRRGNALDRITKIADAVEAFKVKKNLDVANYDELVAKVEAAKAVAASATEDQQQIPSLDCSGDHPRADIADFKDKRSASIDAVKAYRDTVKNLIKAVKAAVETKGGDQ